MLWRLNAFEKKLNGAPANDQIVMGVLTAIQELQNKGASVGNTIEATARLRAALRDRMSTDYGIKESDFKFTEVLNQAEANGVET